MSIPPFIHKSSIWYYYCLVLYFLSAWNLSYSLYLYQKTTWLGIFYMCIPTGYALGYIYGGLVSLFTYLLHDWGPCCHIWSPNLICNCKIIRNLYVWRFSTYRYNSCSDSCFSLVPISLYCLPRYYWIGRIIPLFKYRLEVIWIGVLHFGERQFWCFLLLF